MEFSEEIFQKIVDLQNQIDDLSSNLFKNEFSNTTLITKEVSQLKGGYQSVNFITGSTGWRITAEGNLEANDGNFRGDITGASGTFTGTITATTGAIGGFDIGADYIRDAADSFGLASTVTVGDDIRFWAGATFVNRATAPFNVTEAGAVTVSNITITGLQAGSSVDGQFLAALSVASDAVAASAITTAKIAALAVEAGNIAAGAVTTAKIAALAVTSAEVAAGAITTAKIAADAVTAAEIAVGAVGSTELAAGAVIAGKITAGTIVAADIAAGTITGAKIAATTITAANITALTITAAEIAASTITGAKIAATTITAANITALTITAAEIAAGTITGAKIAALTITASEIAAGTITSDKITVASLSALNANLGTITAGTITLPNTGWIRGGQTDYNTGEGFFLGYSTDAHKLSIGNPATDWMKWDGTNLKISLLNSIAVALGNTLQFSNDTSRSANETSYAKVKEILVNQTLSAVRVKYDDVAGASSSLYTKLYKNGVAIGSEFLNNTESPLTRTNDLGSVVAGDLIQVYAYKTGANAGAISNFRFNFDATLTKLYDYTLTTPLGVTWQWRDAPTSQDP